MWNITKYVSGYTQDAKNARNPLSVNEIRQDAVGTSVEGITLHDRYCYDTMCVTMEIAITFFIDHMEQEVQP